MSNGIAFKTENFKINTFILIEGQKNSENFYIIKAGKVKVSKETEVVEDDSSPILNPGDFFGVVSCMSNHPRIETAVALTDTALISILRDQFGELITRTPSIAMKIIRSFSMKLRYYDSAIARLTFKDAVTESSDQLYNIAEYYFKQQKFNYAGYCYQKYLKYCPNGAYISTTKQRLQAINMGEMEIVDPAAAAATGILTKTFPNDAIIFSEHEPGEELYIIQQGKVKITKVINDNEILLAVLQPGDIFGDMALLNNKPRSASAIAFGDVTTLAVNKSNLDQMVLKQPAIATKLIQQLSNQIWTAFKQLENNLIKDPIAKMFDTLLTQLQKQRVVIEHRSTYTFSFGTKELTNMVGLTPEKGDMYIKKLFENNKFTLVDNKIHCSDLEEIEKQANYFRKIQEMERKREMASHQK